jgi:hypothetical protein
MTINNPLKLELAPTTHLMIGGIGPELEGNRTRQCTKSSRFRLKEAHRENSGRGRTSS